MRAALCLFLLIPTLVKALYIGNVAEPELLEKGAFFSPDSFLALKTGYVGDFVFDRNLHAERQLHGKFDRSKLLDNAGVLIFNIRAFIEVYAFGGAMEANFAHHPSIDGKKRVYQTDNHLLWGGGGRITPFQWGNFFIGFDIKAARAHLPLRWATLDGAPLPTHRAEIKFREWQAALCASYPLEMFFPYFALTYSRCSGSFDHLPATLLPIPHFGFCSRQPLGLALGCSFSSGAIFDLNVEVRLIDEEAFALAGNFQF